MTRRLPAVLVAFLACGAAEAGKFFRALPLPFAEVPFGQARGVSPDGMWVVGRTADGAPVFARGYARRAIARRA